MFSSAPSLHCCCHFSPSVAHIPSCYLHTKESAELQRRQSDICVVMGLVVSDISLQSHSPSSPMKPLSSIRQSIADVCIL